MNGHESFKHKTSLEIANCGQQSRICDFHAQNCVSVLEQHITLDFGGSGVPNVPSVWMLQVHLSPASLWSLPSVYSIRQHFQFDPRTKPAVAPRAPASHIVLQLIVVTHLWKAFLGSWTRQSWLTETNLQVKIAIDSYPQVTRLKTHLHRSWIVEQEYQNSNLHHGKYHFISIS